MYTMYSISASRLLGVDRRYGEYTFYLTPCIVLTLSGLGYLMSLMLGGGGGHISPPLISKSTNFI